MRTKIREPRPEERENRCNVKEKMKWEGEFMVVSKRYKDDQDMRTKELKVR